MNLFQVEDRRISRVIDLDEFGKNSMVFGIFAVNAATCYTFINFTYNFSVRDCNPVIYNASIHPIFEDNITNYENIIYLSVAISVLMKIISVFSYYYAL